MSSMIPDKGLNQLQEISYLIGMFIVTNCQYLLSTLLIATLLSFGCLTFEIFRLFAQNGEIWFDGTELIGATRKTLIIGRIRWK